MNETKDIFTDEEMEKAFAYADFGYQNSPDRLLQRRRLVINAVLKVIVGYHNGSTIKAIITEMGFIGKNDYVTKKGKTLMRSVYSKIALREID